jgi:DNA topoisomerase-3
MVLEKNYLEVWIYDKWTDKDIPIFRRGEVFQPDSLTLEEGITTAPQLLSEPELISLMEKNGIGNEVKVI